MGGVATAGGRAGPVVADRRAHTQGVGGISAGGSARPRGTKLGACTGWANGLADENKVSLVDDGVGEARPPLAAPRPRRGAVVRVHDLLEDQLVAESGQVGPEVVEC